MRHGLGAPLHAELAVDVTGMGLDRVQGDEQALADFLVGTALSNQPQDGQLTSAERFATGRLYDGRFAGVQRQQGLQITAQGAEAVRDWNGKYSQRLEAASVLLDEAQLSPVPQA